MSCIFEILKMVFLKLYIQILLLHFSFYNTNRVCLNLEITPWVLLTSNKKVSVLLSLTYLAELPQILQRYLEEKVKSKQCKLVEIDTSPCNHQRGRLMSGQRGLGVKLLSHNA